MPYRPLGPCSIPGCAKRAVRRGLCERHAVMHDAHYKAEHPDTRSDTRPSAAARGYGKDWQAVRAQVLRAAGIPRRDWPKYDVDHSPRYDASREPDHRKYQLTPRLHGAHSSKTNREDGGFGNRRR